MSCRHPDSQENNTKTVIFSNIKEAKKLTIQTNQSTWENERISRNTWFLQFKETENQKHLREMGGGDWKNAGFLPYIRETIVE